MLSAHHSQRMLRRVTLIFAAFGPLIAPLPLPEVEAASPEVRFGMNAESVGAQRALGAAPDLGVMWIGPWTPQSGWGGPEGALEGMRKAGVTPVIHFYYWGNDISRSCLENGCWSDLHNVWKDKSGWQRLAQQLVDRLHGSLWGKEAVIVLETEFNKGGVEQYEPLDGYLASKARFFQDSYGGSTVVLGFGNWNPSTWGTFDRAMAASDWAGIQAMRASTRDSAQAYLGVVDHALASVMNLRSNFGKPVMLTDLAVSSYPEGTYARHQATVIGDLFGRMDEFSAAGLVAVAYRGLVDNPHATTQEYYGQAERHFGLKRADGSEKPALAKWVAGVKQMRAGPAVAASAGPSSVEAEAFTKKTTGTRFSYPSASGGAAWNLWSNGYIEHWVELSPGTYDVTVWAGGSRLAGVAPHMVVKMDGSTVRQADPSGGFNAYTARVEVSWQGWHGLRVQFTNDARSGGEDRNLWVDRVQVRPAAASASSVEAEAFTTKTTGVRFADPAASAGAAWNLWSNGYIEHWVELPPGTYDVLVRASGTPAGGTWPHMVVQVDGDTVLQADPFSRFHDYAVRVPVTWDGWHGIRVRFSNDAWVSGQDRNLWVDLVKVTPVG